MNGTWDQSLARGPNSSGDIEEKENPYVRGETTGGNKPHQNLPPYQTIYYWLRIE